MNGRIVDEMARMTVEEYYNDDIYEALRTLDMELGEDEPTPEMVDAERDAMGYGQDDRVLCIEEDYTDDGQFIPEWAF